ncbi:proton-conducting transporter transmembrane domain-containing protein [Campylobacter hyointestinalis]|uniref:proton-conducting transporter transmembrane domain-containing protein n=1 Tax=Campylobacter hyointestinalis TaxID=198 RepID=UPI000CE4B475|nr:proton-conducting transporter membrane subunit [Campylobacter hyointestinalis]PPB53606.1 hydrogenase [Campylobacter hyointestinalis subsp. hyointestinalis]PPB66165.1 hydrogenase [Campylobacter hyointestinalis subsp. hyointestinalis]PPB68181.1 hydrogenase [Campylobacter hyointestinalis subsp. hyointestinalis]
MDILFLILLLPLVCSLILFISPLNLRVLSALHILCSAVVSLSLLYAINRVLSVGTIYAFNDMLFLDSLGAVFLVLISLSGFCVNLYSTSYFKWNLNSNYLNLKQIKINFVLSYITTFAMTLSCISNNMAIMWAALEATTLATVFMVALKNDKLSLESGYKYIVICSVGLAFAMFATILLYSSSLNTLHDEKSAILFSNLILQATNLNPDVLKLIFIFALIGFGTKAGLVPTHTWLPDAHAQGPAPTSAMLSGIVIKCAMLGLLRYYAIASNATIGDFSEQVMLISGTLTLFVSAFFLIRQHDIKRMFAYHSVAHMGVIAFGLGVGGKIGVFAAVFHCAAHSFTKALAFLTTGNTARIYGTNNMDKMGNMVRLAPLTTALFGISICSLVGVPGFAIFVSEFLTFKAAVLSGQFMAVALFAVALTIIFIADFSHFFMASFGEVKGDIKFKKEMSLWENIPLILLAFLVISFGVWQFESFWTLVQNSVTIIKGN